MSEITITYETLYDILRREKDRAELQELDQLFFEKLTKYIREKKEILRSQEQKDSIFTTIEVQKTRKQIENIQKIIKELYEKRESKIMQLALMNSRSNSMKNDKSLMLNQEKEIYEKVTNILTNSRQDILHNIVLGNNIKTEPKRLKTDEKPKTTSREVKLKQKLSQFIGTDLNNYGPFEKGDKAKLPIEIAEFLITKNQAEEISNENT
jgi:DNA replication initiation complex subunit (GINS family)